MIIAYFPPIVGGAETQTLRLARALVAQNVDSFVITERVRGLKSFEKIYGVPVYRLFTLGSGTVASLSFMFSSFFFLIKNRQRYQIIHAHLASSPGITATIAGKVLRKKVIVKFAGAGRTGDIRVSHRTFLGRAKLKFLMKYADVLICPSEEVKRELINYGFAKRKVVKIPNGVDITLFHPVIDLQKENLRRRFNLPSRPIVIYVGRLESGKGLAVLLKAWQRVIKVKEGSYLLVVGDGSQKDNLINLAKELKITDSIRFTGQVDNVNEYLQISTIFIFPSFAEGMSNSLLEAMSCGIPVVASDIQENREVIQDGINGLLFQAGNMARIEEQLGLLIKAPELRRKLAEKARQTIVENYDMKLIVEKYINSYQTLIGNE